MRATDVMSTPVVAAGPRITVQHVARMMINHRVSGIPIIEEDGQLIGIITEGDCCFGLKLAPSGSAPAGVNGSCRTRGWPPITSSRTRGE